ncbi:MAG: CYTH domain-containing protein, partial [Bacteroidota bacterium]
MRSSFTLICFILCNLLLGQDPGRIESEYKLKVENEQANAIWEHIKSTFSSEKIKTIDPSLTAQLSEELFYDQYFDTNEQELLKNKAGVRYRKRFKEGILIKSLIQLKLPLSEDGIARNEVKFNVNSKVKKTDPKGRHAFWKYIKPNQRDDVDLQLANFEVLGDALKPKLKLKQNRKRAYISKAGQAFMTLTLDEVSYFYFPYTSFTELELELNEILYTEANESTRKQMEEMNSKIKEELFAAFPNLVQDQTPK